MRSGVYEFLAQDRVVFGKPAAEAVVEAAQRLNKSRVMIAASDALTKPGGVVSDIRRALGANCVGVYDRFVEHVPRASVLDLVQEVRALGPDLIVTVGGGTPMDTVKVALVCLGENISDETGFDAVRIRVSPDGERIAPPVKEPPLRQIIVPTTLSGAEFSDLAGATNPATLTKDLYTGRDICGQVVILDPALTVHTPEWLWLSTGVRAVDHAVETICSRQPQPFTDATCLHSLKLLSAALRAARERPDDLAARLDCQLGVWLASTGLNRIEWGASHGIGHQLGAVANVPHGHCSCVMLPSVLRYNEPVNADRQATVAQALDREGQSAATAVAELVSDLGQPGRLRDVGVRRDQFDAIATGAMQNMMVRSNPRPITDPSSVLEILEMAY